MQSRHPRLDDRRTIGMRRSAMAWGLFLTLTAASGAGWAMYDPEVAINRELRLAAADASNHAPFADLVRAELASRGHRLTATATMGCFWAGEGRIGLLEGVYRTTPGFAGKSEVVVAEYDPAVISAAEIREINDTPDDPESLPAACRLPGAAPVDSAFRADDQPKWYLQQTKLRFVPMTPAQATRINALIHARQPIEALLCPSQRSRLAWVRAHPSWNWHNYVGDARMELWAEK